MQRALIAAIILTLAALCVLAASTQKAKAAFPLASPELAELEHEQRRAPDDPQARAKLVRAYLDAKAPGAASALIERELERERRSGEPALPLLNLAVLVEFHMGRASKAASLAEEAQARCAKLAPATNELLSVCAEIARRHKLLQEFVRLGVEDPIANPELSAIGHQSAGRHATFGSDGL